MFLVNQIPRSARNNKLAIHAEKEDASLRSQ